MEPEPTLPDRKVIACNYLEGTHIAGQGALAYLCYFPYSQGCFDRAEVVARSHGGRWVKKWESGKRLGNFRVKTLPPDHPRYHDDRISDFNGDEKALGWLNDLGKSQIAPQSPQSSK